MYLVRNISFHVYSNFAMHLYSKPSVYSLIDLHICLHFTECYVNKNRSIYIYLWYHFRFPLSFFCCRITRNTSFSISFISWWNLSTCFSLTAPREVVTALRKKCTFRPMLHWKLYNISATLALLSESLLCWKIRL